MHLPESLAISSLRAAAGVEAESMERDGKEGGTTITFQIWKQTLSYPSADVMPSAISDALVGGCGTRHPCGLGLRGADWLIT